MDAPQLQLLTTAEAMALLKVSRSTLYSLGLPRVKLGAATRWRLQDIERMVQTHMEYPEPVVIPQPDGLSVQERRERRQAERDSNSIDALYPDLSFRERVKKLRELRAKREKRNRERAAFAAKQPAIPGKKP